MWKGNLLDRLNLEYDSMSKGQKLISDYIMRNYYKAAFMTAATLSETVGVSESTIVRFAYALGYDGYPKMQKELQDVIQNRMNTIQRLSLMDGLSSEDIINASFKTDINNLRVSKDRNSAAKFDTIVDTIVAARHVYILGNRSSSPLAEFLLYYMSYILENVISISFDSGDVFSQIVNAGEEDVLIAIGFPRYSLRTVEIMDSLCKKGCQTIAITDNDSSPLAQMADYTLTAKSYLNSFVDSFVAPLSIINVLIILLGLKKKDTLISNFEKLEELWQENNVYADSASYARWSKNE